MKYINIAKNYFSYFKNKDIEKLASLFSNKISLKDWNIELNGIKDVIDQNKIIFNDLGQFDLIINNIYEIDKIIFAEIEIITEKDEAKVIDKIEFNSDDLIIKITAYKG